jgi:integrase
MYTATQIRDRSVNRPINDCFFKFAKALTATKVTNRKLKASTGDLYDMQIKLFQQFWGSEELRFSEINDDFLTKFQNWLNENYSPNTVVHHYNIFMGWVNAAVAAKIISYPFTSNESPEGEETEKEYLDENEIHRFVEYADDVTKPLGLRTAAAWFLHGCFTAHRVSDWMQFDPAKHIKGDEIRLRAKKNQTPVHMLIQDYLAENLERIKQMPLESLSWNSKTALINKLAKYLGLICQDLGITKELTSHCGRKTFAVTMCASMGVPINICAEWMGITIETCEKSYYRLTDYRKREIAKDTWGNFNRKKKDPPTSPLRIVA